MKHITLAVFCLFSFMGISQSNNITTQLYDTYDNYKESAIGKRRIKRNDIQPLIDKLSTNDKFKVSTVGKSIGGLDLSLISIGSGETNVFLWSQMHGDEPTATQAIFDILNFFDSEDFKKEKEAILANLTVHFLPMLNPDGAELFQRRNLLGIDINRDALRLQSPESQTLKRVRDSLDADFGFNLHDQSTYYNAERTEKPATISYLAPAYNYEKDINETRGNAMKIIVFMNDILQKYAPGQVGRYNDDFEPRAFGDNIQKWGTSTILIESGGFPKDIEKQEIRKLNYTSILSAIYTIAQKSYESIGIEEYEKIPENDRKLFDLKLTGVNYNLKGNTYTIDLGINQIEVDYPDHNSFWYSSRVLDQGDLSTYYGYETLEASDYTIKQAKAHPKTFNTIDEVKGLNFKDILKQGYGFVRMEKTPATVINSPFPVHLIGPKYKVPELKLEPGINPTFFLEKAGVIEYAVINGFLINLSENNINIPNSMIYK
ncbi:M14 family metallopeptidase [Maribacter hydrothermalis]|uniref:Peptidase M14 n=1 Tax=Maribacter hydrothermalis TaxID=1836467 RepID=A0A1B7Z8L5_9FLAO|nr:M14 metallopeptidase family protein [Maribacter hydrothermalis]APQ18968.1 peptidase M14 [Maribacter hydrothermalis]OBR39019.1 peptidase M14 [Maribacter hydrothermalis]